MAANPPPDVVLAPINGDARTLEEWLTMFHLSVVILDPFTNEAAWILPAAGRILSTFEQADVRVAFVCTATPDESRMFLGPWALEILTFADPDRAFVKALELDRLPAYVHIAMDGTVVGAAEGWNPPEWREIAEDLARITSWRAPVIPGPKDPGPFEGSPALG